MYKKESQLLRKRRATLNSTIKCYHICHLGTINAELVSECRREKVVRYLIHLSYVIISDDEKFSGVNLWKKLVT